MPTTKPAGDRLRAPTARDAQGVAALLRARELADLGVAETGLITTIAVAARARGRGRGRTLVQLLPAAFRAKGLRYAEAAARVFESAGMQVVRETERWEKVLGV